MRLEWRAQCSQVPSETPLPPEKSGRRVPWQPNPQLRQQGPPMESGTRTTYLFQCASEGLFAISPDKSGKTIPRSSCTEGWLLRQEFQLGTQDPVTPQMEPEPVIRGINAKGYYIWRDPCWAQRTTHWPLSTPLISRRDTNGLQQESSGTTHAALTPSGAVEGRDGA
jgi:hypothetical protein